MRQPEDIVNTDQSDWRWFGAVEIQASAPIKGSALLHPSSFMFDSIKYKYNINGCEASQNLIRQT